MLTASGSTVLRARRLRKDMSLPEIVLWRALRLRPEGFKFRRSHPTGFFVLDFFCAEAKLAIEVDGEVHNRGDQPAFDTNRDRQLLLHEIATLRVPAVDILKRLDDVLIHIVETVRERLPLHHPAGGPPPRSGEEFL